ncbi:unnamed protein product, partial [Mesorhabditis spiculigera]
MPIHDAEDRVPFIILGPLLQYQERGRNSNCIWDGCVRSLFYFLILLGLMILIIIFHPFVHYRPKCKLK